MDCAPDLHFDSLQRHGIAIKEDEKDGQKVIAEKPKSEYSLKLEFEHIVLCSSKASGEVKII